MTHTFVGAIETANLILYSAIVLGAVGGIFGLVLAFASKVFYVETDPRVDKMIDVLPGANCGGCNFPGCAALAEAIAGGKADPDFCKPGGPETAKDVAGIMGLEVTEKEREIAVLHCNGDAVVDKYDFSGEPDCRAANLLQAGQKNCSFGCLGFGTCVDVCQFNALVTGENGLPFVIEENCVACGACIKVCPRNLISLVPESKHIHVQCKSLAKGKQAKESCPVACIGCKKCEKTCQYDAIHVNNFLAEIDYEKCVSCGECVQACPMGSIHDYHKRHGAELVAVGSPKEETKSAQPAES